MERVISRILYPLRGHDHLTWTPIARRLQRPTRRFWTGSPQTSPYLVLLRMGFTMPCVSPRSAVSSYLAVSPLPPKKLEAVCFLWHCPPIARRSCYEPSCPVEFGLSSPTARVGAIMHPLQKSNCHYTEQQFSYTNANCPFFQPGQINLQQPAYNKSSAGRWGIRRAGRPSSAC